jgi:hypothetical protein
LVEVQRVVEADEAELLSAVNASEHSQLFSLLQRALPSHKVS